MGCSLWDRNELDTTECTHTHTHTHTHTLRQDTHTHTHSLTLFLSLSLSETGPAYWLVHQVVSWGPRQRYPVLQTLYLPKRTGKALTSRAQGAASGISCASWQRHQDSLPPTISGVTQALASPNHALFVVEELSRFKRCLNAQAFSWVSPE